MGRFLFPIGNKKRPLYTPGETTTIETREPKWSEGEDVEATERDYQAVAIEGNYEDYLEGRLPAFVRAQPHWCAKGVTEVELKPLCEAVGVEASFDCPLYGPPSLGAGLQTISSGLCAKLSALDKKGLKEVAKRWAATMSTPERTHSVSGTKLSDGWTINDAMSILKPIADLAKSAVDGQGLYLLIEA
jgi:hypothetical protein